MSNPTYRALDFLFHPQSIALVGITISNPQHWTRTFLNALIKLQFPGNLYLVNPKGGEINGLHVFKSIDDITANIDYVISTVPAKAAPSLVKQCIGKGVKAIHFCTAGFSETGQERGRKLESEIVRLAREANIRIIGPNCMGIYCPESHLAFNAEHSEEGGEVALISQSGGNARMLINDTSLRGVRFSKVISYGNACDLDESDFLEYLADDPATEVIALYIEGAKDGKRFRRALHYAAKNKAVVMLKAGSTQSGIRAVTSHTAALAGDEQTWDAISKQSGIIRVYSLEEMVDVLVTLHYKFLPTGRNAALFGTNGGASVLIADQFEWNRIITPPLPNDAIDRIMEYTPPAGNMLGNPIDYSQSLFDLEKLAKTINIIMTWEKIDFLVGYMRPGQSTLAGGKTLTQVIERMAEESRKAMKPFAMVVEPTLKPEESQRVFAIIQNCANLEIPTYLSFASAANAIDLILQYTEQHHSDGHG